MKIGIMASQISGHLINAPTTIDYLVVGAGGAGGVNGRGGGAGGELFTSNTVSISAGVTYTCTIGAGANWTSNNARNGSSSVLSGSGFTTVTALAGQDAGDPNGGVGQNGGGSGGNYGSSNGTTGANGTANSLSGSSVTYVGGGGGGSNSNNSAAGGSGGGGAGGSVFTGSFLPTAGTANTGGGGGGCGNGQIYYNIIGGSGLIIIRYDNTKDNAVSTTGSPTFSNSGGYKRYTFTGSGSITF